MKRCSKCKVLKDLSEFHNRTISQDGKSPRCKVCKSLHDKVYYKTNSVQIIDKSKKYYQCNLDRVVEYKRHYYLTNRANLLCKANEYRINNKPLRNIVNAKRRAIKIFQTPELTIDEQLRINILYIISHKVSEATGVLMHVDHIIPLSKGGLHHPLNLRVITAKENLEKHDKLPTDLSEELIALHKDFYGK